MFKKKKINFSLMNVSCLSYRPEKIDFVEHCILSGHSIKIM